LNLTWVMPAEEEVDEFLAQYGVRIEASFGEAAYDVR
jgi:hypothetical protein